MRVLGNDVKCAVSEIFGHVQVLKDADGEYAFVSEAGKEFELNKKADKLREKLGADAVKNTIQVI